MKTKTKKTLTILLFIVITFALGIYFQYRYFENYTINCCRSVDGIICEKYEKQEKISRSTRYRIEYWFKVKDKDTGNDFDISVTFEKYETHNKGDDIHFNKVEKSVLGEECNSKGFILVIGLVFEFLSIMLVFVCIDHWIWK